MTITIGPELEEHLRKKAQAEGLSVQTYVERLIRDDAGLEEQTEEPLDETDPDFGEIRSAVMEGLAQAERGEGRPAKEVFAELRSKYGVSN